MSYDMCSLLTGIYFLVSNQRKGGTYYVQKEFFARNETEKRLCRNAPTSPEKQREFLFYGRATPRNSYYELFTES